MFRPLIASLASLCLFPLSGCATATAPAKGAESPFIGTVSAADPRAEEAGMAILRAGGSATDAAIAVMLALTVVEPQSSGIGGGGFLVRGDPHGSVDSFDGRETAPAAARPDWFANSDGTFPPFMESVLSGRSVGVPGNIALAAKTHRRYGTLPWAALFAPAIALARDGFVVNPRLNGSLTDSAKRAGFTPAGRALYFNADGSAAAAGDRIVNAALADTLERIAKEGPEAFYSGEQAAEIARTVAAATPGDGAMTAQDIESYEAKSRPAVCQTYRAYRVCGMGPPTSGGIAVLQILGQLERFDLRALGVSNPRTWHLFVESQRLAYADRELYLADADYIAVPVKGLIDPAYIATRSALIDPDNAASSVLAGNPDGAPVALADGDEPEERGTSHFAVVGADNTMVSYTSTIEGPFGSGLMVGGFYLNNELTDFSRRPEVDGRLVANRVQSGKRPRSSMSPMVVYDPLGEPVLVVGAAGGVTIPVQTARSIIGIIDFALSGDDALGLPLIMAFGDTVLIEEETWMAAAADQFAAFGHGKQRISAAPLKGNAILRGPHGWVAAHDPRLATQIILP